MEWHGGQPDNAAPPDFGFNCDAYPNSYSYPTNTNMYSTPYSGHDLQNDYYSSSQNENYYNHYMNASHQNLHPSYHVQDSSRFFRAPVMPHPVAPRVHINPNYKPKIGTGPESDICATRPTNVHINPHWKGRIEPVSNTDYCLPRTSCNKEGPSKNTIFVNPKVLSRIKIESLAHGKEPCPEMPGNFNAINSSPNGQKNTSTIHEAVTNKQNQLGHFSESASDKIKEIVKDSTVPVCVPKPAFVVLSSTKLVRNTSANPCQKSLSAMPVGCHKTKPEPISLQPKTIKTSLKFPGTPTIKIAKQVCSKYRLVRHSTSTTVKSKSVPTITPRRSRRKSISSKMSSVSAPNSIYKFVRKPTGCEPSPSLSSSGSLKSLNSTVLTHSMKGNVRKNVKTRYKLVINHPAQQRDHTHLQEAKKSKSIRSRYKLVCSNTSESTLPSRRRNSVNKPISSELSLPQYPSCIKSRFKIRRNTVENKIVHGRKVSRFRVISNSNFTKLKAIPQSLWKLRKCHESLSLANPGLQKPGYYGNLIWRNMHSSLQIGHHRPSLQSSYIKNNCAKTKARTITTRNSSNKSLLNIGGALYRSTRTSLTRAHPGKSKEKIVSIRGRRFVLDGKGTTLRPASDLGDPAHSISEFNKGPSIGRVDIGGVTFTRRSDNTLVRTNTHYARNLLSIAKMRSIALLTDKLRKNNQPCLIYHRFGRCRAYEEGKCWRVHDPKNISVCRKFLQGSCDKENCLLSHNVGPEKMPTCRFFLEGCCVRDNCPYLHVKLSARAAICRQFLHGYCEAGDMCKKRHVNLCPDFEQDGKCSKGKYCPYPHGKHIAKKGKTRKRFTNDNDKHSVKREGTHCGDMVKDLSALPIEEAEKRKRYYDESTSAKDQCTNQTQCSVDLKGSEVSESKEVLQSDEDTGDQHDSQIAQRRPKLGILPAYIPLE